MALDPGSVVGAGREKGILGWVDVVGPGAVW
jgi:hypothetical protein